MEEIKGISVLQLVNKLLESPITFFLNSGSERTFQKSENPLKNFWKV
jgi:hypothetical protein